MRRTKKEWIKRLSPYWKEYRKLQSDFNKKTIALEERMRKEQKEPNLEFAYSKFGIDDGDGFFGIGFQKDMKKRPPNLIHDTELEA